MGTQDVRLPLLTKSNKPAGFVHLRLIHRKGSLAPGAVGVVTAHLKTLPSISGNSTAGGGKAPGTPSAASVAALKAPLVSEAPFPLHAPLPTASQDAMGAAPGACAPCGGLPGPGA